jgi:hypothetical protein
LPSHKLRPWIHGEVLCWHFGIVLGVFKIHDIAVLKVRTVSLIKREGSYHFPLFGSQIKFGRRGSQCRSWHFLKLLSVIDKSSEDQTVRDVKKENSKGIPYCLKKSKLHAALLRYFHLIIFT